MISWQRVAELREEVGEDEFSEVVALFLDEVEGVLDRMKHDPRRDTLEGDLHFVRGSAMTLGFALLSELCHVGERRAAAAEFDKIDIPAVVATYRASKSEFVARLA